MGLIFNGNGDVIKAVDGSLTVEGLDFEGGGNVNAGIVTGTSANFTGNVSVGGVLTYEDVKNVDSVGIITARDKINMTQGYQLGWLSGSTNRARIHGDSGSNFIVETGASNTERLRITSGGAIGINTSVPSTAQDLTFDGASNYKAGILYKQAGISQYRFMCEGGTGHVYYDTFLDGGDHVFRTNAAATGGTEYLRITEELSLIHI